MTQALLKDEKEKEKTRAEEVVAIEKELFEVYQDQSLDEKPKALEERGGAYYLEVAVSLIDAIVNNKKEIHTVNVMNSGAISNVPDDVVVEVGALITKNGAKPLPVGKLPITVLGLVQQVKVYEQLTIKPGVFGDEKAALQALYNNPLVNSFEKSKGLLADILRENMNYLPQFKKRNSKLV